MKILQALIVIVMAVAMLGVTQPAAAQMYTYTSGYQVQNLSGASASITLTYYAQQTGSGAGGAQVTSADDSITGLGSKTYFPIHAAAGFKGSVVISSSQPLASIVNLVANGVGNASYVGSSAGSSPISLPLLMKGNAGITTWFSVQNTGTSNATVNVSYSDGTSAGPVVVLLNASYVFNQGAENHNSKVFAATITSNQPVAVVAVQEANTVLATSGFAGGSTSTYIPLVNTNNAGYKTGIQLQNIGDQQTTITLSYTPLPGAGTACTETRTIAPGASDTFALGAFSNLVGPDISNCTATKFVGGARVTANTANQPVVAVVNQTTASIAGAYNSFASEDATAQVVFPLIMDRNSGWYTGITVANVGADTVTVNCSFLNSSYTVSAELDEGEVLVDIQNGKIGFKYVGSATCTASGSGEEKIVGVVNEVAPGSGDGLLVYEGVNVTP